MSRSLECIVLSVCGLLSSAPTLAGNFVGRVLDETDNPPKSDTMHMVPDQHVLGEVVVTATRTPKALKDVPVVTRLIQPMRSEKPMPPTFRICLRRRFRVLNSDMP